MEGDQNNNSNNSDVSTSEVQPIPSNESHTNVPSTEADGDP